MKKHIASALLAVSTISLACCSSGSQSEYVSEEEQEVAAEGGSSSAHSILDSMHAATMRLIRREGSVDLTDKDGKERSLTDNLRLQNGDTLTTGEDSLAGISLDDTKAALMDQKSQAQFTREKDGKYLEIDLNEGNIFFSVDKKLENDESFEIRSSNMVMGIRGTSGYVSAADADDERLTVTDGKVHVTGTNLSTGESSEVEVSAGQQAAVYLYDRTIDSIEFQVDNINEINLPKHALRALSENSPLSERVTVATGWSADLLEKYHSQQKSQRHEEALTVYAPIIELYANLERNQFYGCPRAPYELTDFSPYYSGLSVVARTITDGIKPISPGTLKYYVGDLSDTGVEQLIIATGLDENNLDIIKLFSIKNSKPVDLLPDFAWNPHRYFSIHTHNIFLDEDAMDRPVYHNRYYRLCLDGSVFQTVEHITYIMSDTEEPYYTRTKQGSTVRISDEEAQEIISSYELPPEEIIWENVSDFHNGETLTAEAKNADAAAQPLYEKFKDGQSLRLPPSGEGTMYEYFPINNPDFPMFEAGKAMDLSNYDMNFPINVYALPDTNSDVISTIDNYSVPIFIGTYKYNDSYREEWLAINNTGLTKGYIPAYELLRPRDEYTPLEEIAQRLEDSGIPSAITNDLVDHWPDDDEPLISAGETVPVSRHGQVPTNVYAKPDNSSEIVASIPSGDEVTFMGTYHYDWMLITYNGQYAFIKTADMFDTTAN